MKKMNSKFTSYLSLLLTLFVAIGCRNQIKSNAATTKNLLQHKSQPGAKKYNSSLATKLKDKYNSIQKYYIPRTKHRLKNGQATYTNRLFLETSPYLLQHAHNPVNWYPWGTEAFEMAKKLKRPIFLSIGYSTCHWCHVMEEESFEDIEIARYLNENYIAIKVDREERPDVDAIYMSAVQALTGSGGWPMSVWLSETKKPFYGATYLPARDGDRGTRTGFLTMLKRLKKVFNDYPLKVKESSDKLTDIISKNLEQNGATSNYKLTNNILDSAINYYKKMFDFKEGGLNRVPKFPSSLPIKFLLRQISSSTNNQRDKKLTHMITLTLKKMANGGMYDHVAGGFHRYSTDKKWLVPHFEKMLYDNALLAVAYIEAYQVTKDSFFKRISEEILDYIIRDMTSSAGAFYSAMDADSIGPKGHQEEGYYYTWTPKELNEFLKPDEVKFMSQHYNVKEIGNFEHGRSILNVSNSKITNVSQIVLRASIKEKLYLERNRRPPPIRDDKILTSWNGLMISAFAQVGFILNNKKYINTAIKAGEFIWLKLQNKGRLYRTYKGSFSGGEAKFNAYLDDYAFVIAAYLDLYHATSDLIWLRRSITLNESLEKYFEDKKNGGFYMTSHDHEKLLAREKPAYDGAEPSGNSVAALNLLRLNKFTTNDKYRKTAMSLFKYMSNSLSKNPMELSELLLALDFLLKTAKEIIILVPPNKEYQSSAISHILRKTFLPNKVISIVEQGTEQEEHREVIPLLTDKVIFNDKVTAYVCKSGVCKLPTTDPLTFQKQINE
ncbi:MAG: thioredoxin domain-containing protein [Bacteriovoracaceae bacterium]|jgi:uncharacterized protein|nr:thioredoxin domain-containing protein [Bacteriovoracaceae bacterium]